MKYLKKYKLFESPNSVDIGYKNYDICTVGALVFSYYSVKGKLKFFIQTKELTGDYYDCSSSHMALQDHYFNEIDNNFNESPTSSRGPKSGRLFTIEKVITFWHFPKNQKELKEVSEDIKREIGLDIYKENYKIEIINNKDGEFIEDWYSGDEGDKAILIPVQDYNGSEERSKEELESPHLMKPEDKKKWFKDKGYKSKISKWKKYQKPFENKTDNEKI